MQRLTAIDVDTAQRQFIGVGMRIATENFADYYVVEVFAGLNHFFYLKTGHIKGVSNLFGGFLYVYIVF